MAGIDHVLASMGYTPGEARKRSPFEQIVGAVTNFGNTMQDMQKKNLDYRQKQFEMYKTLIEAGYTPKEAADTLSSGKFLVKPSGLSKAEIALKKEAAELLNIEARTNYYNKRASTLAGDNPFEEDETAAAAPVAAAGIPGEEENPFGALQQPQPKIPPAGAPGPGGLEKALFGTDPSWMISPLIPLAKSIAGPKKAMAGEIPAAPKREERHLVMKAPDEQVSPYKEYPDAFLENGIWKVKRNGKKYKLED